MTKTKDEIAADLAKIKHAAENGDIIIGNEAALAGAGSVRVQTWHNAETGRSGLCLQWSRAGIGFGELTISARDGKLTADMEGMSDQFCIDVFTQALKEATRT